MAANKKSSVAPRRISFAKIREPLEVPNLLALQVESVDWLLGNDAWRSRIAAADSMNRGEIPTTSGLEEIFEEISPIEDFQGSMSLSFRDHRFEPPKYSIGECKERDMTYSQPLFVTAEFTNNITGEIKSQTVFMGDFPVMTPRGTFVINGTERVVVSQLVRSPGVYFERTIEKASDKDVFTAKVIPSRGAWLEFEVDKKDLVGVRIDRKRKQSVTVFLKALGWTEEQILEEFGDFESMRATLEKDTVKTQDEALLDIYRKLRSRHGGGIGVGGEERAGELVGGGAEFFVGGEDRDFRARPRAGERGVKTRGHEPCATRPTGQRRCERLGRGGCPGRCERLGWGGQAVGDSQRPARSVRERERMVEGALGTGEFAGFLGEPDALGDGEAGHGGLSCAEEGGLAGPRAIVEVGHEGQATRAGGGRRGFAEKQMSEVGGAGDGRRRGECGEALGGGRIARPDGRGLGADALHIGIGELRARLHADAEEIHRLVGARAESRFGHEVVHEPARQRALKR